MANARLTDSDRLNMSLDYESGMPMQAVGKKYRCSITPVRAAIIYFGKKIRSKGESHTINIRNTYKLPPDIDIKLMYDRKLSCIEIADKYGCSETIIRFAIKRAGGKIRSYSEAGLLACWGKGNTPPGKDLRIEYELGNSSSAMSKKYSISPSAIIRAIKRAGGKIRSGSEAALLARCHKNKGTAEPEYKIEYDENGFPIYKNLTYIENEGI